MLSFRGSTVTLCGWLKRAAEHASPNAVSRWPPVPHLPATVRTAPVLSSMERMQEANAAMMQPSY